MTIEELVDESLARTRAARARVFALRRAVLDGDVGEVIAARTRELRAAIDARNPKPEQPDGGDR